MRGWEISQGQDPGWLFWSMIGLLDVILTGIPSIELCQSLFTSSENRSLGGRTRTPPPLHPPSTTFHWGACHREVPGALTAIDRSHQQPAPRPGQGPATAWLAQLVHSQVLVLCIIESQQSCLLSFPAPWTRSTRGPTGNSSLKLSLSTSSTSAGLLLSSSFPPCPRPASPS